MNTPQPINMDKLKSILGGAKSIMDKGDNYEKGNIDSRALTTEGINQMESEGIKRPQTQQYKNLETTKLPSVVRDIMINNPIPQGNSLSHTFNLDDVPEIVENYQKQPVSQQPITQQINNSNTFTVSEVGLRAMVNDILLEFMTKTFTQNLGEDVIKKTIGSLIKEGKIRVKKKV